MFINNEVTWLLVAYFDILFALNNVPHPGAKRLLEQAERLCPRRPPDLPAQVGELLRLAAAGDARLLPALDRLVDDPNTCWRTACSGSGSLSRLASASSHSSSIPKGCRKAVSSWRSRSDHHRHHVPRAGQPRPRASHGSQALQTPGVQPAIHQGKF